MRALVRSQWGEEVAERTTAHRIQAGAVLTGHDDDGNPSAWAMSAGSPAFGAFVDWARSHAIDQLHLCTSADDAAAWARRGTAFNLVVTVWRVVDATLVAVAPVALDAADGLAGPAALASLAPAVQALAADIEAAGADAVVERGVLRAEVLGLEVARVVEGPLLAVGVGHHDREARSELFPIGDTDLGTVVATVARLRVADAPVHPANQLAPERWLRAVVLAHPELVGATSLEATPAPIDRTDLRDRAPAPAVGVSGRGEAIVVVCSVGVDPDLVPLAADARLAAVAAGSVGAADAGQVGLVLVVPEGDDYPLTRQLAGLLRHPAAVFTVGRDWRRQ